MMRVWKKSESLDVKETKFSVYELLAVYPMPCGETREVLCVDLDTGNTRRIGVKQMKSSKLPNTIDELMDGMEEEKYELEEVGSL